MARKILVADLLCGAGGSSTGCQQALADLGLQMELVCVNHWGVAIETHKKNHPEARHYCQDIATVRPHIIVPEGYLDLLMASPTCTHHSVARGGKPTSDQQRSDPWHIIPWFTELRVKRAIIENVWEFCGWGPVDPRTGKPIKARKGEYFNAWVDTIRRLGATSIEYRKLNAADYGDATTRQRFIMMIRFDGKPIVWPVATHRKREDGKLELFPGLKPWRPAREIIDWSLKGQSIFNRKKPLAPKTLARIYAGAVKFAWPEPFLVILRNHMAGQSVEHPLPTIAAHGTHIGLAQPVILANRNNNAAKNPDESPSPCITTAPGGGIALAEPVIINGRKNNKAKSVSTEPVPTLDTKGGVWLAQPVAESTQKAGYSLASGVKEQGYSLPSQPLVLSQHNSGAPRSTEEPLPTVTTGGAGDEKRPGCARPMLVEPLILNRNSAPRGETRPVSEPVPTPMASGAGYLIEPFVATVAHGNDAKERDPNKRRAKSINDPLGTIHGDGAAYAVVEPFVLSRHGEGAPRSVQEPVPTQVAKHSHVLIAPYYGSGSGETCQSAEAPLPSATSKARFGMVVPVTHAGEHRARDVNEEPIPTITTANRGELAFITAQHGERPGQAPRVHDIGQPTPTIAASGHVDLIEATESYDILFRMLEPHELAAAMGFTSKDQAYEFAGTKTDKIKQIGNAVSVAKMRACARAIMADAAPKGKRANVSKEAAA